MRKFKIMKELFEKKRYVIDFLPKRVPADSSGQYFDVEYHLLNSNKHVDYKNRFVNVILKLMCYYDISILWEKWIDNPSPELIENIINTIMKNHSGSLEILFMDENTLMVFEWDCLYLAVFNPNKSMKKLMKNIAISEGLVVWRS